MSTPAEIEAALERHLRKEKQGDIDTAFILADDYQRLREELATVNAKAAAMRSKILSHVNSCVVHVRDDHDRTACEWCSLLDSDAGRDTLAELTALRTGPKRLKGGE